MIKIINDYDYEIVVDGILKNSGKYVEFLEEKDGNYHYKKLKKFTCTYDRNIKKHLLANYIFCDLDNKIMPVLTPVTFEDSFLIENKKIEHEYKELYNFMEYAQRKYKNKSEKIEKAIVGYIQEVLNIEDCGTKKTFEIWIDLWRLYESNYLLFKVALENIIKNDLTILELVEFNTFNYISKLSTYYLIENINSLENELLKEKNQLLELELQSRKNFYTYVLGILIITIPLIPVVYDISKDYKNLGYIFLMSILILIISTIASVILKIVISEKKALYPRIMRLHEKIVRYGLVENIEVKSYQSNKYVYCFYFFLTILTISIFTTFVSILY